MPPWAQMSEGTSCCRIPPWQPGMLVLIRKCPASSSSDAVSETGLSWIQLWLVAFVAGSRSISHPASSSALQRLHGITREPWGAWGSVAPCLDSPTRSQLPESLPPPGEQVSWQRTSVCLTQPFPDVPFCVAMVGVRMNPRKCWVSSLLVSLPTAHNSRSICTALPLPVPVCSDEWGETFVVSNTHPAL